MLYPLFLSPNIEMIDMEIKCPSTACAVQIDIGNALGLSNV